MKIDTKSYFKHANHRVVVNTTPVAHNIASLRCFSCDKHLKWLGKQELMEILPLMAPEDILPNHGTPHHGNKGVKTRPVRSKSQKTLR